MKNIFSDAQIHGFETGEHPCPECGTLMHWEDEWEDVLICPNCGYECESDHYGFTDEEYNALYPTKEEVCGTEDENDEDEDGESYDDVFDGLGDE